MAQLLVLPTFEIALPNDDGVPRGKKQLFREESPTSPVTFLQVWIKWVNVTGGNTDSIGNLSAFVYGTAFGESYPIELFFSDVDEDEVTTYQPFELFALADPADGFKLLRLGNFNIQDGRSLRMFGENIYFKLDVAGTAYTGGTITACPVGWIE